MKSLLSTSLSAYRFDTSGNDEIPRKDVVAKALCQSRGRRFRWSFSKHPQGMRRKKGVGAKNIR
jgi:hypothetical protein